MKILSVISSLSSASDYLELELSLILMMQRLHLIPLMVKNSSFEKSTKSKIFRKFWTVIMLKVLG